MPFQVNDNLDPNNLPLGSNIIQTLNILATQIKQLSGKATWRTKPDYSIATAVKGDKGDTGATGLQGIQGEKGDKGDTGEPASLEHQHAIAQVQGLQTALDAKTSSQIITSATQPTNPTQGLIWNELNSNNNLVEVWRYINGFWWSEEKLFNVFTPTNTSGINYYLAMNPAYNYFIKSAHLLFEVGSTTSYSSVFNFLFQHKKGGGDISTPFTQSFNITAFGVFTSIFSVNTKVTSTTDAYQNLRFILTRTSGSNMIIPSLAIYYHLIRK